MIFKQAGLPPQAAPHIAKAAMVITQAMQQQGGGQPGGQPGGPAPAPAGGPGPGMQPH